MASFFGIKTKVPSEFISAENSSTKEFGKYTLLQGSEKPKQRAYNYFYSQLVWNEQLLKSPDGLYTWILKDIPERGKDQFIAGRTRTKQETGTLHNNLDFLTGPGVVRAAGELRKTGLNIEFNLQSGTYTKKIMDAYKSMGAKKSARDTLATKVSGLLRSFNIDAGEGGDASTGGRSFTSVTFLKEEVENTDEKLAGIPMIDPAHIITTAENRATLNRLMNFIPGTGNVSTAAAAAPTNTSRKRPRLINKGGARRRRGTRRRINPRTRTR